MAERIRAITERSRLTFDIIGTVFDVYGSFSRGIKTLAGGLRVDLDAGAFAVDWMEGYRSL